MSKGKQDEGAVEIEVTAQQKMLAMIDVRIKALQAQRQQGAEAQRSHKAALHKLEVEDSAAAGAIAILESMRRELAPDEVAA